MDKAAQLKGLKVCFVGANRSSRDTRMAREVAALVHAGAEIVLVSADNEKNPVLEELQVRQVLLNTLDCPQLMNLAKRKKSKVFGKVLNKHFFLQVYEKMISKRVEAYWGRRQEGRWPELEQALIKEQPDAIHCINLYSARPALNAFRKTGARLVYDSYEHWPSVIRDPNRSILFPADQVERLEGLESDIAEESDLVITVSEPIANYLRRECKASKVEVVYNGAAGKIDAITPISPPYKLLIQGDNRPEYMLPTVLEAMRLLSNGYELTLQGNGYDTPSVKSLIEHLELSDRVIIAPLVPFSETVLYASSFDIGIHVATASSGDDEYGNMNYTIPNRLFTYFAAGLAVCASDLLGCKNLIQDSGAGEIVASLDPADIAKCIDMMCEAPERLHQYKEKALCASEEYTWDAQSKKLVAAYANLLGVENEQL